MTTTLAIDIGGTKTLVALVDGMRIIDAEETATRRGGDPVQWCNDIAKCARKWNGAFETAGTAVTGVIAAGRWSALNPETLDIPNGFPLADELTARLGKPVTCFNDAQAAAWGEHAFGAGERRDLVFITISTGIGCGVVINGKLLIGRGGLGGSAGLIRLSVAPDAKPVEALAAGRFFCAAARHAGHDADARSVFRASAQGESWARAIIAQSADAVAALLHNIQLLFDPPIIVVGGGVGLAPGYAEQLNLRLAEHPPAQRPEIRLAALGKYAGVIGAADLAQRLSKH
jgi:N-acetylmannosamine-6-phosphate 2-epimerase / N-acetylmannosamine kinase